MKGHFGSVINKIASDVSIIDKKRENISLFTLIHVLNISISQT